MSLSMKLFKFDYNVKIMQPWIIYCKACFYQSAPSSDTTGKPFPLESWLAVLTWKSRSTFIQSPRGYDEEEFFRIYSDRAVHLTVSEVNLKGSTCKWQEVKFVFLFGSLDD